MEWGETVAAATPAIAIMGHSTVEMTRHYQQASPELVRSALEKVAGTLQLPGA